MTFDAEGYPLGWQADWPGPYPLGMPIWLDSWGDPPALVHYGNGTNTPGPLLPIRYVAETTLNFNAGLGPPLAPLDFSTLSTTPASSASSSSVSKQLNDVVREPIASKGTQMAFNLMPFTGAGSSPVNRSFFVPGGSVTLPNTVGSNFANTGSNSTIGTLVGAAAGLCDDLPAGWKEACKAAAGAVGGAVGGAAAGAVGAAAGQAVGTFVGGTGNGGCPPGYVLVMGRCVAPQNALPGGQPLTLSRNQPTTGGMGLAALTPTQVGTITRKDGTTGPLLRCPAKYVLGMDFLCYPKAMIPNQLRAHPRGTRPLLTGGEVRVLNRARALSKKVGKLGTKFGPKHCHCATKKRGKK